MDSNVIRTLSVYNVALHGPWECSQTRPNHAHMFAWIGLVIDVLAQSLVRFLADSGLVDTLENALRKRHDLRIRRLKM